MGVWVLGVISEELCGCARTACVCESVCDTPVFVCVRCSEFECAGPLNSGVCVLYTAALCVFKLVWAFFLALDSGRDCASGLLVVKLCAVSVLGVDVPLLDWGGVRALW